MKVGGSYDIFTDRSPWPRAAAELGLGPDGLIDRVAGLAARAPDAFADAAATLEVGELRRGLEARLVNLVSERVTRCVALLDAADEATTS